MDKNAIERLAWERGVRPDTVRGWIRRMGEEAALTYRPLTHSQRGKLSKKKGHWLHFRLPGSPDL